MRLCGGKRCPALVSDEEEEEEEEEEELARDALTIPVRRQRHGLLHARRVLSGKRKPLPRTCRSAVGITIMLSYTGSQDVHVNNSREINEHIASEPS